MRVTEIQIGSLTFATTYIIYDNNQIFITQLTVLQLTK
jgi:hypothetical protein